MLPGYNLDGNDYSKTYNDNWMSMGLNEWTILRSSNGSNIAFDVDYVGGVFIGDVGSDESAVRPSFSLLSSIKFTSGEGTKNSPIRIAD